MSLDNTNALKATEFIGRGLNYGISGEQRALIDGLERDQQEMLMAQTYYEKKYNKRLDPGLTQNLIEQEYGKGATAQIANTENRKPFELATLIDLPADSPIGEQKVKLLSSVSDINDAAELFARHLENKFDYMPAPDGMPYSVRLREVGEDDNGFSVYQEEISPHFPAGYQISPLTMPFQMEESSFIRDRIEGYKYGFGTEEGREQVAQNIDAMPGGRFSAGVVEGFAPFIDVPTSDPDSFLDYMADIGGNVVGFIAGMRVAGKVLGRSPFRRIPAVNKVLNKLSFKNPAAGKFAENALNYASYGAGYRYLGSLNRGLTTKEQLTEAGKGAVDGLAFAGGGALLSLRTIKSGATGIAIVGGAGMATAPEGSTPEQRMASGATSVLIFSIFQGLGFVSAKARAKEFLNAYGVSEANANSFLNRNFNFAESRSLANRLDLGLRQVKAARDLGYNISFNKGEVVPYRGAVTTDKPAPEVIRREIGRGASVAPTLADIRRVHNNMTPDQIASLVPRAEATQKGRQLLLNMYNNPTQKNLDQYNNYKYSNFFKPREEVAVEPVEDIVKKESDIEGVPPPENAQKTQVATTVPTYEKSEAILNDLAPGKTLDFGAGRGKGAEVIGATTYEPYPREGFTPDFTDSSAIPSESFEKIISPSVLNVVPKDIRDGIVADIGRILKPNGAAIITVRSVTDVKKAKVREEHPSEENAFIVGPTLEKATFQKGFTPDELITYLQAQLGDGFEVTAIPKVEGKPAPSGVSALVRKLGEPAVAEDAVNVVTKKGTVIDRYKKNVGKRVGSKIYVHKDYATEVVPADVYNKAVSKIGDFEFNTVMYDTKTGAVRFDEAPGFNTEREPRVGKVLTVNSDGTTKQGSSNNIWHHKWLWVKDDYTGFDVGKSRNWSSNWASKVDGVAKGTQKAWDKQLAEAGLTDEAPAPVVETAPVDFSIADEAQSMEGLRKRDIETLFGMEATPLEMNAWSDVLPAVREEGLVERANYIADQILADNRPHSTKEYVALLLRSRELREQINEIDEVITSDIGSDLPVELQIETKIALQDELEKIASAALIGGQEAGSSLQIRRMTFKDSYNYEDVLSRLINVTQGKPTAKEKRDIKIDSEKIDDVEKRVEELEAKATKKDAEEAFNDLKTKKVKTKDVTKEDLVANINETLTSGEVPKVEIYKYFAELVKGEFIKTLDEGVAEIKKIFPALTRREIIDAISNRTKSFDAPPTGLKLRLKQLRRQALLESKYEDALKRIFDPVRETIPTTKEIEDFEQRIKLLKAFYTKNIPAGADRKKLLDQINAANKAVTQHYRNIKIAKPNDKTLINLKKELASIKQKTKAVDTLYDLELTTSLDDKLVIIDELIKKDPYEAIIQIRDFVKTINAVYEGRVRHASYKPAEAKPDEQVIPLLQNKIDNVLLELTEQKFPRPVAKKEPRPTTEAQEKKRAELKAANEALRLRNKLYEVQAQVDDKKIITIPLRTTNEQLKAKIKELTDIIKIYNPPTVSKAKQINNLNKQLLKIEDQINKQYSEYKMPTPPTDPAVAELRRKVSQRSTLRRVLNEVADLEEQLRTGSFKSKYVYEPKIRDEELEKALVERTRLKNQVDATVANAQRRHASIVGQAFDMSRGLVLSYDVGHIGRQGSVYLFNGGGLNSLKFAGQSIQALFSQKTADQLAQIVRDDPNFGLAKLSGLRIIQPGQQTQREELAMSIFLDKLPGIKQSARAQINGTNLLRMSAFSTWYDLNPDATIQEMKAVSQVINVMTGYGTGKILGADKNFLDPVLTSKRFTESRVQMATGLIPFVGRKTLFKGDFTKEQTNKGTKYFQQKMSGYIGLRILFFSLATIGIGARLGMDGGKNPEHWTFGKIIVPAGGGYYHVIDPWGGAAAFFALVINAQRFFATGGKEGEFPLIPFGGFFSELSKRVSPPINLLYRAVTSTTYPNEEVPRTQAILRATSPITFQNTAEAIERRGQTNPLGELAVGLLDAVGIPSTTLTREEVYGKNDKNVKLPKDWKQKLIF